MKLLFGVLLLCAHAQGQGPVATSPSNTAQPPPALKWKMDRSKWITGGLVFVAGTAKGLNETLLFHWKTFHQKCPGAPARWFNPAVSWKNKYRNGNASEGSKFPLSTSVLVMATDQYHLDNFVMRMAWMSAIAIRIGEKKKPFKYYLRDLLYYSACHQLGFALSYYPFDKTNPKGK